ncbi:MAG: ATP-binding protein [Gemmatimonadota bacterium]|nr:ATP-binding protein [Gemmatimonadota bacterium]
MPKSASEYAALLEGLNEGVIAFDRHRIVVLANAASIRLLGLAGQAVVGRGADELFAASPELLKILEAGFRGCLYPEPRDLMLQQGDGGMRRLGATTSYLKADSKLGLVLVVQDVSALKQMEWETYQVAKMSALGRLAASVAHEVRNPLGAVDIQLQLLEDDLRAVDEGVRSRMDRRLKIAQMEMKRLDRIVHNFLRFSRTPRLDLKRVCLNNVVQHVFDLVSPEARDRGIRLDLDLCDGLPAVSGDDSQLGQAVLNITVNAFQAMESDGQLCARTWLDSDAGHVCLSISDTGCGIPDEEIDRIFEYYYTTRDEGTGLGLSIAQQIIYQHRGHIEVESETGKGTVFRIHMPIAGQTG